MGTYLHTMYRITDLERSRAFYEALGFTASRSMDIVRNGELEATNHFFSMGDQTDVLELTHNHDGRGYEMGTAYGEAAVQRARGWFAPLLRARPGRLPHRADRTVLTARGRDGGQPPVPPRSSRRRRSSAASAPRSVGE